MAIQQAGSSEYGALEQQTRGCGDRQGFKVKLKEGCQQANQQWNASEQGSKGYTGVKWEILCCLKTTTARWEALYQDHSCYCSCAFPSSSTWKSLAKRWKWGTKEKLASLGLKQNHREIIKQTKNISESMSTHTKIYGLLTTPILHTILIPRKKEKEKNQPDSS